MSVALKSNIIGECTPALLHTQPKEEFTHWNKLCSVYSELYKWTTKQGVANQLVITLSLLRDTLLISGFSNISTSPAK